MKDTTKTRKRRPVRKGLARAQKPIRLRGLLPTPPEVAKLVDQEAKRLPMTPEARQRVTDGFNLQYYFGGDVVAARETPKGVEVLAVGLKEIGELIRRVPPEQRQTFTIEHPDPW